MNQEQNKTIQSPFRKSDDPSPENNRHLSGLGYHVQSESLAGKNFQSGNKSIQPVPCAGELSGREPAAEPIDITCFNAIIPTVAQVIESGFVCFLNPDTLELEPVSGKMLENPDVFYASTCMFLRHKPFRHLLWSNCIMFEPLPKDDLYQMTEAFMQQIINYRLYSKLGRIIKKQKSFAKINAVISRSKHSADWKEYKGRHIEKHVRQKLISLLNDSTVVSCEKQIITDNQLSKDLDAIPVPLQPVCLNCRHRDSSVPEIKHRCQLIRYNLHMRESATCKSFEKI